MADNPRPPGWYQHPGDRSLLLYWDGQIWTGHTAPVGSIPQAQPAPPLAQAAPVQSSEPAPVPARQAFSTRALVITIIGVILVVAAGTLASLLLLARDADDSSGARSDSAAVEQAGDDFWTSSGTEACRTAAEEAVRISADQGAGALQLIKVRGPRVAQDNRDDVEPPTGTKSALVLRCEGAGVWSSGSTTDVVVKVTIDADEDMFVFYAPVSAG